jgi:CHAT domain-containing protein
VVRYLDLPSSPKPLTVKPPLRVLVATAEPKDASPLNAALELDGIRSTLAPLSASRRVEVDVLASARRDELLARLRRGYQVLHYVGHGTFGRGEGYLLLEDADGRADAVSASLLSQMVTDSSLRLVVLNACETAVTGVEAPLGGLAHQLARAGIPAVVAMQMAIADPAAFAFSREFYGALADGWPVEAAVQEGRRSIMTLLGNDWNQRVDWATPTLYMRAADGAVLVPDGARGLAPD